MKYFYAYLYEKKIGERANSIIKKIEKIIAQQMLKDLEVYKNLISLGVFVEFDSKNKQKFNFNNLNIDDNIANIIVEVLYVNEIVFLGLINDEILSLDLDTIYKTKINNLSKEKIEKINKIIYKIYLFRHSSMAIPYYYTSCFSSSNDDILLWGYYGSGLRGICIEFDENKVLQESSINNFDIEKVDYSGVKINNDLNNMTLERAKKILTSKNSKWKHEEEYRFLLRNNNNNFSNEKFVDIPIGAITSIIVGEKATADEIEELYEFVANTNKEKCTNIKFKIALYNMNLENSDNKIIIKDYDEISYLFLL